MAKKVIISLVIALTGLTGLDARVACSQDSILATIMDAQPAIVTVHSQISGVAGPAKQAAAIDPRTGRMVVMRNVKMGTYERYGAGVIIHPDGIIVTNAHNIYKANRILIIFRNNTAVSADVIRFIGNMDIALLKINPPFPLTVVALADSDAVRLGDEIITIGNSAFLKQTVTGGKVIGLGANSGRAPVDDKQIRLIQTSINLYEGDSGGPLFDYHGQLIGLMTAKETAADHSSFAVPSNEIRKYLLDYLKTGTK